MLHDRITQCAIEAIENKRFDAVEQFFRIHDVVYIDEMPKIDRIDTDNGDETAVVYFPVKNEKFHLAMYLNLKDNSVTNAHIESYNRVFFAAYSDSYDFSGLSAMTKLKTSESKNKGDKKRIGDALYQNNWVVFEPNPEPDEFGHKLKKLLDFLETDKAGIKRLVSDANGHIQVEIAFHNGHKTLGGPHLGKNSIQRLAALNLEINFDLYSDGV